MIPVCIQKRASAGLLTVDDAGRMMTTIPVVYVRSCSNAALLTQVLQHYKYIWERPKGGARRAFVIVNLQPTPKARAIYTNDLGMYGASPGCSAAAPPISNSI